MKASPLSHPSDLPDAELAALAARADTGAFEILMRRYNQLLFRTARSILKSDEETQDAVQEAYLNAWRALPSFRSDAKLSTWLVRIVIRSPGSRSKARGLQCRTYGCDGRWPAARPGGSHGSGPG